MNLYGLASLYKSLKAQNIERYRFDYKCGKVDFDVFFFIDGSPFILLFGVKGENFSFEIEVKKGFSIEPQLDKITYKKLCEVLGLKYNPEQPFSPLRFFSEFNTKVPTSAHIRQIAKPQDIAPYKKIAEEKNKIYFVGWRDNHRWGTSVQESNLEKTKELLGERAYIRCKQKNISSCWTDQKEQATEVLLP